PGADPGCTQRRGANQGGGGPSRSPREEGCPSYRHYRLAPAGESRGRGLLVTGRVLPGRVAPVREACLARPVCYSGPRTSPGAPPMNHRLRAPVAVSLALCCGASSSLAAQPPEVARRPTILVILSDDLGFSHLGRYSG